MCQKREFMLQDCLPVKFKGAGVSSFPKYFVFASLCSFICLQAVYQLSGPEY